MTERLILSGNEAIARGAWEVGVSFGAGYPGTPSSEILPALTLLGDVYTEWSVNEKCALEAAAGASLAGARCLVTMKHVGLNVAADPFFTLSYTGVTGGLVLISADDPAMHSSQNEQDNRHYARAAKVPMLEPADSQEARDFTRIAFELSERFDTPVLIRTTTRIAHSDGIVQVGERQILQRECEPIRDPQKLVMIPVYARQRRATISERTRRLVELAEKTDLNREEPGSPALGIIASGVAYQYAKEVAPDASFFKLGLTWPLPPQRLRRFAASVQRLVVVEELDPYLREQIQAMGLQVEQLPESLQLGELRPERVASALSVSVGTPLVVSISSRESQQDRSAALTADLPPRPPVLCPGCPHRGVFLVLRKLKAFVTGDIGCYTLGTLPPLRALDTCLCMGAGIGQVHGIDTVCRGNSSPVGTELAPDAPLDRVANNGGEPSLPPTVAVIGDSTFIHSGITGLVNIAYNGGTSVVMILDNGTTAMTGGQDHPGTGVTLSGRPGRRLDLPSLCRAAGIPNVEVVNPRDLAATEALLRRAVGSPEPWVIIAQGPCVLTTKERSPAFAIDENLCVRCGLCLRVGCPAIGSRPTDDPKKPQPVIDAALCQGCALCVQTCPKQAIGPGEAAR